MGLNEKVRFAIIGCGRISYRHIEAIQANPQAELAALCDLDLARAEERNAKAHVKVYRDYREMLTGEDIDVVCLMTPSGMHVEHALDVIENYGKHVLVEKPMALSIEGGLRLIEAAKRCGVQLFAVHQNRYNKAIQKVKTAIDGDLFGRLTLGTIRIRWSRGQDYYDRDPWRGTWAMDGGVLTNQSIHHIDLLRWLVGEVESVSVIGATQLVDVEVEDMACGWVKFKNGAMGAIEATTATRPPKTDLEASISILGANGAVIVEGASVNRLTAWTFEEIDLEAHSEFPPNVYGFGHDDIIGNVVSVLTQGGKPLVDGEEAMKSLRFLHAIYSSIEQDGLEMRLDDNPASRRLGVLDDKAQAIANLYRTGVVLGGGR